MAILREDLSSLGSDPDDVGAGKLEIIGVLSDDRFSQGECGRRNPRVVHWHPESVIAYKYPSHAQASLTLSSTGIG